VQQALQRSHRTFHFTGHGAYNFRKPEESAIALTNGLLTARAIAHLNLPHYTLACIAACETAITGKDGIAAEYVGLASAFLKAGVASVVSTLWQVNEISSDWLMIRFYQCLLAGNAPAIALNHAQRWLQTVPRIDLIHWIHDLASLPELPFRWRKELEEQVRSLQEQQSIMEPAEPPYAHPFYWAGFTLTGNPSL
jgi:CHAT domain-containing protein